MSIHSYPGVEGASLVVLKQVLVKELTASGEFVLQITHEQKAELQKMLAERSSGRVPGIYPYCSFNNVSMLTVPVSERTRRAFPAGKRCCARFAIATRSHRKAFEECLISPD